MPPPAADDEEEQGGAAGPGGAGGEQMLYIPGLGYIPLSSLSNVPGLNLGGARGGPAGAQPAAANPEGERPWRGLEEMPEVTRDTVTDLVGALRDDGKSELTVLLLGKGGVGKSSTVNSLLQERAASVAAFQQDAAKPTAFSRATPDGFVLTLIDTPSVLDQDAVSDVRLEAIAKAVATRDVDVVLFLDRLDTYAADALDAAVVEGLTRVLGPRLWDNAILCFTRASEGAAPPGVEFEQHAGARAAQLRAAVAAAGGRAADLPVALLENSSRCPVNGDGEKVVPGEVPWVADLLEKAVDVALNTAPFEWSPKAAARAADPNRRRKWLIPLVLAAQVAAKLLLDRVLADDGCRGDANGPFDAETVRERREELAADRAKAARRQEKKQREARAPAPAAAEEDELPAFEDGDDDEEWDE